MRRALVAKRADEPPVETEEIRALCEAAGYEVGGEVTQVRPLDPRTVLGAGKVEALGACVEEAGAEAVVFDDALTPTQTHALREELPGGTRVLDRRRLVLEVFAEQAETERAQLQVERARLEYALPRIEAEGDVQAMNVALEKGTRLDDIRDRIDTIGRTLAELPDPAERFRERRREQGFDLVTLAGYTNAGKSTLLHRLADDLDLADHDHGHDDVDATAAIEDRLFKTLETTTRRATIDGRRLLLTDTVGFVDDLPFDLVESFGETLSEAAAADAVVLLADASDPADELRGKLRVSMDVLSAQGVEREGVVTALNKVDLLRDDGELDGRIAAAAEVAPEVVPVSAIEGLGLDRLGERVLEHLPTEHTEIRMPNCPGAMEVVSWAYDHLSVEEVEYGSSEVRLSVSGRPDVVERARAKAESVASPGMGRADPDGGT